VTGTLDVAIDNVQKALAYIASIPMPNGADPRMLKMNAILHPPALTARFQQITKAQFIAQSSTGGGGGSADISAVIQNFGLGTPMEAPELGSAFGGSDSAWYVLAQEITSNELGAFVYVDREPFSMIFHGAMTDADLARKREFQWVTEGRNVVGAGHPYLMFKASAT
jgi:phage major head subunit gpT-like protein